MKSKFCLNYIYFNKISSASFAGRFWSPARPVARASAKLLKDARSLLNARKNKNAVSEAAWFFAFLVDTFEADQRKAIV